MRLSAELAVGIEDIARANTLLEEQNARSVPQCALECGAPGGTRKRRASGKDDCSAERDIYVAISEDRRAETEMIRNSTSWKLTEPLRRGIGWLRAGRRQ